MRFVILKFKSVKGTNDIAMKLIKKKKESAGFVYAEKQTEGRGRRGKKWVSKKGNLYGTIFFPLKKNYPPFNEFTIISPVIISNVLLNFISKKDISFKWPNDILVNKKKICGILQEVISLEDKKFLIIGIGINIESNPIINKKYKATNILLESKKKPKIKKIVNLILSSYKFFFRNLSYYNYENYKKKLNRWINLII